MPSSPGASARDLYYRLNVFPIHLPPLRERRSDILLLADHFLQKYNAAYGKHVKRISTTAINMMMAYHWPGNVRELENCLERAVLTTTDDAVVSRIHAAAVPADQRSHPHGHPAGGGREPETWWNRSSGRSSIDALKRHRGVAASAARHLQTTQRIINYRIKHLGISPKDYRQ